MFRNIIWDVDGTLFDTYPAIAGAFHAALRELGHDAALDWIEGLAKVSLAYCASTLAEIARVDADAVADRFDAHYSHIQACDQTPFPGVATICKMISARGGKNVIVTHRGRAGTEELLAASDMTSLFSALVTRDDGFPKKPDPASFLAAIQRCELLPNETLAVGDRDIDVEAGKAAGVFTCLFGSPANGIRPNLVIGDFAQLEQFLRQRRN